MKTITDVMKENKKELSVYEVGKVLSQVVAHTMTLYRLVPDAEPETIFSLMASVQAKIIIDLFGKDVACHINEELNHIEDIDELLKSKDDIHEILNKLF